MLDSVNEIKDCVRSLPRMEAELEAQGKISEKMQETLYGNGTPGLRIIVDRHENHINAHDEAHKVTDAQISKRGDRRWGLTTSVGVLILTQILIIARPLITWALGIAGL